MIFGNAKDIPLNQQSGTVPNVSGAMINWFQPMVFGIVVKTVQDYQVVESMEQISFQGVWQPLSSRKLMMKPEGQQSWSWFWLHSEISLKLENDQVVNYNGVQYRVMSLKDYKLYGYYEYELVEDYTGSGPTPINDAPLLVNQVGDFLTDQFGNILTGEVS